MPTRRRHIAVFAPLLVLACRGPQPDPEPRPGPPPAPREDIVEVIHGQPIEDPYRWLEDDADPRVQAWVEAQDDYARERLAASPHVEGLRAELRARWDVEAIVGPVHERRGRYFYARRHRGRDKPVYYVREGQRGRERVLIDPAKLSRDGSVGVRSIHPSPDGRTLAYALRRNAADAATLHVMDVASGETRAAETIFGARFAMPQWAPDSRAFYYVDLPEDPEIPPAELAGHATVRRHMLGEPSRYDEVLYGPTGDPRTIPMPQLALGDRYLLLHLFHGSAGTTSVYIRDLDDDRGFLPLVTGSSGTNYVFGHGEQLYLLTSEGAPHYRVLEVDLARERSRWTEVLAEAPMTLEQLAIMRGHFVIAYLDEVNPRVFVQRIRDGRRWELALPEHGSVLGIWTDPSASEALIGFGSLASSDATIYRVPIPGPAAQQQRSLEPEAFWAPGPEALDYAAELQLTQRFARSADGTRAPVFVLHREDVALDGSNPAILYGYGGFGISIKPGPNSLAQLWAKRGGVWA